MNETKQRILDAAREHFANHGTQTLSMRALAREVGISAPAIYRHFENKEALLLEVCGEGFGHFGAALLGGLMGKTPEDRLVLTGLGYLEFALKYPQHYRIMFMMPHPNFDRLNEASTEAFAPTFHLLIDRVSECQRAGVLAGKAPEPIALAIWSQVHGMISLWLNDQLFSIKHAADFRTFYTTFSANLIEGLR